MAAVTMAIDKIPPFFHHIFTETDNGSYPAKNEGYSVYISKIHIYHASVTLRTFLWFITPIP